MIRAVHIDDEPAAREHLALLLADLAADVRLVGQYADITAGQQALEEHRPDLLFLDVEMPGGDGFELLRRMGRWDFHVVFTTAFQRYAIQAIRFSALDYLLKPVQADELRAALDRATKDKAPADAGHQEQVVDNLSADPSALRVLVSHGGRQHAILPADILYCRAENNYTEIHLQGGRRFLCARTLKDYDDMLQDRGFLRVHRSFLVNRAAVENAPSQGPLRLTDGTAVEVSVRRRAQVIEALRA
ncbi:MAG: response regulator transcription factor [Flavobacteriales bacterium]|nr:response regulator transcription factor [Flavobacteriales bacterium]MBP9079849.1 response regulator transcription factor [Flavobacteriales bacterium]